MTPLLLLLQGIFPLLRACLQCDDKIRTLHDNFILSAPSLADQIALKSICEQAHQEYIQASQQRKGVIDPTTLYKARTEYENEFNYFWKAEPPGTLTSNTIQIVNRGREILEQHLDKFILDGLCPNNCGFLKRRVMNCVSCHYQTYTCPTAQLDCGEHSLRAEEGGQAVLNCFFSWHRLLLGKPEYHYTWAPGDPSAVQLNENDFKVLVVTEESSVVLNQLEVQEQGTYRCILRGRDGTVFSQATFLLTVEPLPKTTRPNIPTLYAFPLEDDDTAAAHAEALLLPVLSAVTALSLAASVGVTIFLRRMTNKRRAQEGEDEEEEEARRLMRRRNTSNIV